jgi:hypothetical protein
MAGPCRPDGIWQVSAGGGPPERVEVRRSPAGLTVTFPDRKVPEDTCGTPKPGKLTVSGEASDDGCSFTIRRSERYCFSGEDQCDEFEASLTLCGDGTSARGTGSACRCWEPSPGCTRQAVALSARREAP